ncbi:LacI family DNA-binding transcriptional regulator [Saccharicrinis sp. GN24d3]|uniref:LacI family DNA-binding transcriptional regulator n=1 Tax=Saccharicrinis sp. GN24d3 TaxID=3458416 RepID=UPI004036C3C9
MKKATLSDIAKELGVSTGLVSMVINGKARQNRISEEMSQKVMDKAAELNYRPNQFARGLKTGRSNTIGLIVADIANPFFGKVARAVEDYAGQHGFYVMFCSSDENPEKSDSLIKVMIDRQVDGLIIAPTEKSENQILSLKKNNIPFVLIDRFFPKIKCHRVVVKNKEGAYSAVSHLIKMGARTVGYVDISSGMWHMKQRFEGYKAALREAGVSFKTSLYKEVQYSLFHEDMQIKISDLISENPDIDAIFFPSNILGIQGIQVLKRLQKKIPDDIAIACFDDPEHFSLTEPGVSAIAQPIQELSRKVVDLLVHDINVDKKEHGEFQQIELGTQFIIRGSSG